MPRGRSYIDRRSSSSTQASALLCLRHPVVALNFFLPPQYGLRAWHVGPNTASRFTCAGAAACSPHTCSIVRGCSCLVATSASQYILGVLRGACCRSPHSSRSPLAPGGPTSPTNYPSHLDGSDIPIDKKDRNRQNHQNSKLSRLSFVCLPLACLTVGRVEGQEPTANSRANGGARRPSSAPRVREPTEAPPVAPAPEPRLRHHPHWPGHAPAT